MESITSDSLKRKTPEHGNDDPDFPSLKRVKIEGDLLDRVKNDIASVCPLCERKGEIKDNVFLCRHCKRKFNNFSCVHCTEKFTTMPALLDHINVCYQKHVAIKTEPGEQSGYGEMLPDTLKEENSCDSSSELEKTESSGTKKQKLDDMSKNLDDKQIKMWVGKFRDFIKKQTVKIKATEQSDDPNAHTCTSQDGNHLGHETQTVSAGKVINSTDLKTKMFRVADKSCNSRDISPVTSLSEAESTERYSDTTDTKTDSQMEDSQMEETDISDNLQTQTNSDSDSESELSDASGFEEIDITSSDSNQSEENKTNETLPLKFKFMNQKNAKQNADNSVVNSKNVDDGDKIGQSGKTSVPETQHEPVRKQKGRPKKVERRGRKKKVQENNLEQIEKKTPEKTKTVTKPITKKRGRPKKVQENSSEQIVKKSPDTNKEKLPTDYICGQCKRQFQTLSALTNHKKSHGKNIHKVSENQPRETSPISPQVSSSSDVFGTLEGSPKKELICGICKTHFTTMEKLSEHMQSHVSKCSYDFVCNQCERKCESLEKLREHMRSHQEPSEEFVCGLCQLSFSTASNLETHIVTHNIVSSIGLSSYTTIGVNKIEKDKGIEQTPPTTVSQLLDYRPKFAIFHD